MLRTEAADLIVRASPFVCLFLAVQIQVLPERVHSELLDRVVGLAAMAARDRLDGAEWHQSALGFHRAGGVVAGGDLTTAPISAMYLKTHKKKQ